MRKTTKETHMITMVNKITSGHNIAEGPNLGKTGIAPEYVLGTKSLKVHLIILLHLLLLVLLLLYFFSPPSSRSFYAQHSPRRNTWTGGRPASGPASSPITQTSTCQGSSLSDLSRRAETRPWRKTSSTTA